MKKKERITEKSARRWLKKNSFRMQKLKMGIGSEKGSCFHKQMLLCQKVVQKSDKEMEAC